jgi:lipid A 3-O-deacylase
MRLLFGFALAVLLALLGSDAGAVDASTTAYTRLGPLVIHGNEADTLLLGAGAWDLRDERSPAGTVEYRFGRKVFVVGLSLGLVANTKGGLYGYAGIYSDLSLGNFYITPQLAMGGYHEGNSTDLGGVFQFRESIDIAYRFANGHRLGVRGAHISNADTQPRNPGEEEVMLTYSLPLGPYL